MGEEYGDEESESIYDWCLCPVGRFIQIGALDFTPMQQTLASLWRPGKGVYTKELETNLFLF